MVKVAHASPTAPELAPVRPARVEVLFGPHEYRAATITLERRPKLAIATLHSVTNKSKILDEDVDKMLLMGEELIALNIHFTVMHDLRQMSLPSRKQTRMVRRRYDTAIIG